MRINTKMKLYLDHLKTDNKYNFSFDLASAEYIIFPKFLEWDGCILLKKERNNEIPTHFTPNQVVPDRTAFEADYNHIHLNDFFDEEVYPDTILNIGIKIFEVWAAILYKQFNGYRKLILILSYDGEDVVLRFYTLREKEVPWLNLSRLESYFDGLMFVEI